MIKDTFRAFASAAWTLHRVQHELNNAKLKDSSCNSITVDFDTNAIGMILLATPAWTAFAVEIGLKTLLVHLGIEKSPRGHSLVKLFDKLPAIIKNEIIHLTMKNCKSAFNMPNHVNEELKSLGEELADAVTDEVKKLVNNGAFKQLLKNSENTFEQWRYFHEENSNSAAIEFLQAFLSAIYIKFIDINKFKNKH